eukprot:745458-Prymnesium_polylepis.1
MRGSPVTAAGIAAQRGCMGTCVAQALAVRLPRQMLCGAASHEHVVHVRTTAAWPESTAETCGSTGGTLGSCCVSAVQCARTTSGQLNISTLSGGVRIHAKTAN